MSLPRPLTLELTRAFLGGPWTRDGLYARASQLFAKTRNRPWLWTLVDRILGRFSPNAAVPVAQKVVRAIEDANFTISERSAESLLLIDPPPVWPGQMLPGPGPASRWPVPPVVSVSDLAEWLFLSVGELEWFANRGQWNSRSGVDRLSHYCYRWVPKRSGGLRLLESPKPRLKRIQRQVLDQILGAIPIHESAHAFRAGRSVVSFVEPHQNQQAILHIDLREFFPSISAERVNAVFRTAGYPEEVASRLTGICTTATPSMVLEAGLPRREGETPWLRWRSPHLPQGAPTSPTLANLCSWKLDQRLAALATAVSARYTRYADDLVFSGDRQFQRSLPRLRLLIAAIILDEGFDLHQRKTRVLVAGTRQQVAGIRLNHHANIPRETYDELKAILHNCRRFGPHSQNHAGHLRFREHLQGRLAYWSAICPDRMTRLQRLYDQIDWSLEAVSPEDPVDET